MSDLLPIMSKILARSLMTLRGQVVMSRLVNTEYGGNAKQKGAKIDIPIPVGKVATDVAPSSAFPEVANSKPKVVSIALDNWKHCDFKLTDKDMAEVDKNAHFIPMEMGESIKALSGAVNQSIMANYKGVYGFTGTPGTTPFSTTSDATQARKVLQKQGCPKTDRRAVLNMDADAAALELTAFADAEKTGDNTVKIEGEIGRKFGIDWFADDNVIEHIAGTLTGNPTVRDAALAGVSALIIECDGDDAVSLKEGDIIEFAGDSQTYAVLEDLDIVSGASGQLSFAPDKHIAVNGTETISVKGDHVVNLAFHRDAFAFANRPLTVSAVDADLSNVVSMTDPVSGISMRLEVTRLNKQTVWDLDILWGDQLVRPELATRIAG